MCRFWVDRVSSHFRQAVVPECGRNATRCGRQNSKPWMAVQDDEPKPQLKFAEAAFRKKVLIDLN
jgi:hypothetical protein